MHTTQIRTSTNKEKLDKDIQKVWVKSTKIGIETSGESETDSISTMGENKDEIV